MPEPTRADNVDELLDILGQQPGLQIYTQICLCYAVPNNASTSHPTAPINTLTRGLERLTTSFPWVAGQVVNEGASEGSSGVFKIRPYERAPRLVIRDYRHDPSKPTMDDLRQAEFPMSMLDETVIAPRNTLPGTNDPAPDKLAPVFILQANFINGGLILTFNGQHQTMDMTGQGQLIDLLSKACRNEPFPSEDLRSGNLPRRHLIPYLDDSYEQGPEVDPQILRPTPAAQPTTEGTTDHPAPPPLPKTIWAYFSFPASSLAALKSLAMKTLPLSSSYISTDDALTAFIWQSIMRARLPRLDPDIQCHFARAVDARRYLNISPTYPGLMQNMTYHSYALHRLVNEEPLGSIASNLRAAVDPQTSDIGHRSRALATLLNRAADKSFTSFTAKIDLRVDIMLSSWSKMDFYELDFGLGLGTPEAVRRPCFTGLESLLYLMPKALDGEISAAICLREEDMERLKVDEEFAKYARYIG